MADMRFYHGGLPEDFDFSTLDPFRLATKQQKRGRNYAGFYMLDNSEGAKNYAKMNNGSLHQIDIRNDARIKALDRIERMKQEQLRALRAEGYDLVRGPNSLGKTEYVLLNPDVITETKRVDDINTAMPAPRNDKSGVNGPHKVVAPKFFGAVSVPVSLAMQSGADPTNVRQAMLGGVGTVATGMANIADNVGMVAQPVVDFNEWVKTPEGQAQLRELAAARLEQGID